MSLRFLGGKRVKRGRGELTDPFVSPKRDVELEAIQCGRGSAGYLRQEGAAPADGGGTLEGSCGGGFSMTLGQRGRILPRLP